jgi:hypothetical protein
MENNNNNTAHVAHNDKKNRSDAHTNKQAKRKNSKRGTVEKVMQDH